MGNPRGFYPLHGINTAPSSKIPESTLLNAGYSTTVPSKKYFTSPDVPYVKDVFDTRIMFSNVQVEDDFRNAYRIFQGLDYKDIERQYGAIIVTGKHQKRIAKEVLAKVKVLDYRPSS